MKDIKTENTCTESESVQKLLKDRYFLKNESCWNQLASRVSELYPPIKSYIESKKFIPSTPTLLNANTKGERFGTFSSCFPMGISDSITGIFDALKEAAVVTKMGGGVGYDFSVLRGSGENVDSINRESSGPIPFMQIFNAMLDGIQQGGVRRGAGMGLLSVEHPNIMDFIKIKKDLSVMKRLNLSVKIPDSFYQALANNPDQPWEIKDVKTGKARILMDEGHPVSVKELWKAVIHNAWFVAEPGIFNETIAFDRCTNTNYDKTVICNPCQEFVNIPNSSCNLGSVNLTKMLNSKNEFDWSALAETVKHATLFLNEAIDANNYPTDKIKETTLTIRPIGLGVMGLASLFYKLRIPYNSDKAFKMVEEISRFMTLKSMQTSIELAKKNKKSYKNFDYDLFVKANERFFGKNCRDIEIKELLADLKKYGVYNSCFTSFAPTGSIATIAEVSNGIEPIFALAFTRNIEKLNKEYDKMYIVDSIFGEYVATNHPDKKEKIFDEVSKNGGSCQKCTDIPEDIKKVFVTANDLTAMEHLDILEASANNISLSVSKTINLPKDATEETVEKVFLEAHKRGIIGVTVYRDGCRGEGILVRDGAAKDSFIPKHDAPKRPDVLECDIYHMPVSKKLDKVRRLEYMVLVGLWKDSNEPYEVFAFENGKLDKKYTKGKIRKKARGKYDLELEDGTKLADVTKDQTPDEETITKSFSSELRHGVKPEFIVHRIEKSREEMSGFVKSISKALKKYVKDGIKVSGEDCPVCKSLGQKGLLVRESGCIVCKICNWSKCG